MKIPQISSNKLLLRGIEKTDINAIFSYRSLEDIARYQYWEPFTLEQTQAFVDRCVGSSSIKEGEWIGLAIIYKDNEELIGDCAIKTNGKIAEIGCNISPKHQNEGLAKETLNLLINFYFHSTDIEEIYGITDSKNMASIKLMESAGMVKLPNFEEIVECKGKPCVEHKYLINKSDYTLKQL